MIKKGIVVMLMIFNVTFLGFSCKENNENRYGSGQTTSETPGETPGVIPDDDSKIVLAYLTSWSAEMPDYELVTHVNYSFGRVNETYSGVTIDNEARLRSVVDLKKKKSSLKILLSIGGWTSGRFSEMAMTENNRKNFAADCKRIVDEFNLDGIDLDWEYPTSNEAGISASPKDRENFTLLMQEIRKSIGNEKLLTFASAASAQYYDFKALSEIVNFVNIMMYDVDSPPYHHSALHRSELVNEISADESIAKHIENGMSAKKLVLGIPFYGHGDTKSLAYSVDYKNIIKLTGFVEKWDDVAKVPYLVNTKGEIALVYENARSIAFKCEYLLQQHLRGAMYWEYSSDDAEGTLRNAVWKGIMK
ncbi:MAG: glycoside hydrolase [Dysgonamonadaceae bacterium]|jgi:chitinase|nr:glycoside hydrolase [Dysgonamonadaceae bacterium]